MAKKKVFKIKNDMFIDSSSIMHNKELLSKIVIHDSGNNSNGSWIRWENGLMICFQTIKKTLSVNQESSSNNYLFKYYYGYCDIQSYPQPFTAPPTVIFFGGNAGQVITLQPYHDSKMTATSPGGVYPISSTKYDSTDIIVSYIALGTWK